MRLEDPDPDGGEALTYIFLGTGSVELVSILPVSTDFSLSLPLDNVPVVRLDDETGASPVVPLPSVAERGLAVLSLELDDVEDERDRLRSPFRVPLLECGPDVEGVGRTSDALGDWAGRMPEFEGDDPEPDPEVELDLADRLSIERKCRYKFSFLFDPNTFSPSRNALAISYSPSLANTSPTKSSTTLRYASLVLSIRFRVLAVFVGTDVVLPGPEISRIKSSGISASQSSVIRCAKSRAGFEGLSLREARIRVEINWGGSRRVVFSVV